MCTVGTFQFCSAAALLDELDRVLEVEEAFVLRNHQVGGGREGRQHHRGDAHQESTDSGHDETLGHDLFSIFQSFGLSRPRGHSNVLANAN
jgi:hypothetical protein